MVSLFIAIHLIKPDNILARGIFGGEAGLHALMAVRARSNFFRVFQYSIMSERSTEKFRGTVSINGWLTIKRQRLE